LLDTGPDGQWISAFAGGADLGAPHLVGDETASLVRRRELASLISPDQAAQFEQTAASLGFSPPGTTASWGTRLDGRDCQA
jgi:hypothetical protein